MIAIPLVGVGVDAHAAAAERPLWLGEIGLAGHSDADAAAHALCDALLSAAGLGDLGSVCGIDDPRWAEASGVTLLSHTAQLVREAGFVIGNGSVQIVGNRPRIGSRRQEAQHVMSAAIGAPRARVRHDNRRSGPYRPGRGHHRARCGGQCSRGVV